MARVPVSQHGASSLASILAQPLPLSGPIEVHLMLPCLGFRIVDAFDSQLRSQIKKTAEQLGVKLDMAHHNQSVIATLWGMSKPDIDKTIKAIRFMLDRPSSGADFCHPCYVIESPAQGRAGVVVALASLPLTLHPKGGVRGQFLGANNPAAKKTHLVAETTQLDLANQFGKEFQRLASYLLRTSDELRMRVNFGTALFTQMRVGDDILSYDGFEKFARQAARRGTGNFKANFGGETFVDQLLSKICLDHAGTFQPDSTQGATLGELNATFCLIFLVKGLKIEIPLRLIKGTQTATTQLRGRKPKQVTPEYTVGTYRVFRQENRLRSIEIIAACPQKQYDWHLEVLKEVDHSEAPFTIYELRNSLHFDVHPTSLVPTPKVAVSFGGGKIATTMIRAAWEFNVISAPNVTLDVGRVYQWNGIRTLLAPSISCGVSLYQKNWPQELKGMQIPAGPRAWSDDYSNLFESDEGGKDGYRTFMKHISVVHDVIEEVARATARISA